MGKIVYGILAVVAYFFLAESLTCNQCGLSLVGVCMSSGEEDCTTNTSVCFTARASFSDISDFAGFSSQGCREPSGCNGTTNDTLLGFTFQTKIECCDTDKCNPVQLSGAASTQLSVAAIFGAALLTSVWTMV